MILHIVVLLLLYIIICQSQSIATIPYALYDSYVWTNTSAIYMKANIYVTSYASLNFIICSSSPTANLENEFGFFVVDTSGNNNFIPGGVGRLAVYNGKRTVTLGIYYSSGTVPLNTTVTVTASRTAAGVWSMTIAGQSQTVTKATMPVYPTAVFGNVNIPVYVGADWTQYKQFSGYVSNVVLSGGTSTGPSPTVGISILLKLS